MVAISLYKGNLHKAPNLPHRWLCPAPNISLKDFRTLLRRRDRTLTRLRDSNNPSPKSPHSNNADADPIPPGNAVINSNNGDCGNHVANTCPDPELPPKGVLKEEEAEDGKVKEEGLVEGEGSLKKLVDATNALVKEENFENGDKGKAPVNSLAIEKTSTENGENDVEKRKKEIEEKLEVLNEKKHSLVQVLKQILKAEEQLKRQNSMQGMSSRPPLQLQVDTTATDSGSVTRLNTPKTGSDGNPSGDMEGGEPDDVSNHITHLPRMSSTSPSSDTQQRKPASNTVGHPHRAASGALPPSPAASGGTSASRLPSPWN